MLTRSFVAALLVTLVSTSLLLVQTASAQSWQVDYDPGLGTLPSAQGWTHIVADAPPDDGLDEGNYLVSLGALTQGDTGGSNTDAANLQYYEISPTPFDLDDDVIVIDLRVRILASTLTYGVLLPAAGFGLRVIDDGFENVLFFISDTGLLLRRAVSPLTSPFVPYDTTSDFVDYRLRLERDRVRLFADGTEVAQLDRDELPLSGSSIDRSTVRLGDISTADYSSSQLEEFSIARFGQPTSVVRNYESEILYSALDSSSTKSLVVNCPPGTTALTGGASTVFAEGSVGISESRPGPESPPTSWHASAREMVDTNANWQLRVDVICGEVSGYERLTISAPPSTDAEQVQSYDPSLQCPEGKQVISGGAGFSGADLRQVLHASTFNGIFATPIEFFWHASALDYGATTSSSPWSIEAEVICSDATRFQTSFDSVPPDAQGVKSQLVQCQAGKVPVGGGAAGGAPGYTGQLRSSRPKYQTTANLIPVGWESEAQSDDSFWGLEVFAACAPIDDPTVSKNGLQARFTGQWDAYDSYGWSNGTLHNGVGFAPGLNGDGQAFSFDGQSDQWVEIPTYVLNDVITVTDLYPEADFSVAAWIRMGTLPAEGTRAEIASLYDYGGTETPSNSSTWSLGVNSDGVVRGYVRSGASILATTTIGQVPVVDGEYHHVALVRDTIEGRLRVYVDGVLDGEDYLTTMGSIDPLFPANPNSPDPIAIGAFRAPASTDLTHLFTGEIDDVMIYDRRITAEEIENMAGCGRMIGARTLNLDASQFASPSDDQHGLCVYIEAGTHDLTIVDPAGDAGARFTGWSPSATGSWGTRFRVEPELDAGFSFGLPVGESSGQAAFDNTLVRETTLTLSAPQRVYFSLEEDDAAYDNRGGVSIRLLPEPGMGIALVVGGLLLQGLARRRQPGS